MQTDTKTTIYHPEPCPDCGGRLFLTTTKKGLGYICENIYEYSCMGNAGAHEDGSPKSIPGTRYIRALRRLWHHLVDPLWKQYPGERALVVREKIYKFMQQSFGQEHDFHVGELNEEQLHKAINIAQTTLRRRFQ